MLSRDAALLLALGALTLGATASGCVLERIDLSGRECPCIEGWMCDEVRDRCIPEIRALGDAGPDGSRLIDGSAIDAARGDAGSREDARAPSDAGLEIRDATTDLDATTGADAASEPDGTVPDAMVPDDAPDACLAPCL